MPRAQIFKLMYNKGCKQSNQFTGHSDSALLKDNEMKAMIHSSKTSKVWKPLAKDLMLLVGAAAFLVLCADIADDSPLVDTFGGWLWALVITKAGALLVLALISIFYDEITK